MIFHYGGKYESEEDLKSRGREREDAIPFREPDQKVFAVLANGGSLLLFGILLIILWLVAKRSVHISGIAGAA